MINFNCCIIFTDIMMWPNIVVMMVTNYLSEILNIVIGMHMNGLATKNQ